MMKFSILGYGHIGRVHKKAIEQTAGAELISIVDSAFEGENPGVPVFDSLQNFLKTDFQTDVVCIATPNGYHKSHAIACLNAGKHVLIEKPMALNTNDAMQILEAAHKNGKRVFSSMQLRFSPPVRFVKQLLEQNKLGEIYMVNIQCYWNRNKDYYKQRDWSGSCEMDGGVLFTQFSHFVDIMNFWFEKTSCLHSSFFNFNHKGVTDFPDSGLLEFNADNAKGSMIFTTSIYQKNYKSSILLMAEKGTIEIGDQYLNQVLYCNVQGVEAEEKHSTETKNFHPQAMAEVMASITDNRPSVLDGSHAVRLVEFIDGAHLSGRNLD
jgi:predicted dehydrogenase